VKLTLEEIGVILGVLTDKVEKASQDENEHYNKALISAYIKLLKEEHERTI
jgi:hypothetical protein